MSEADVPESLGLVRPGGPPTITVTDGGAGLSVDGLDEDRIRKVIERTFSLQVDRLIQPAPPPESDLGNASAATAAPASPLSDTDQAWLDATPPGDRREITRDGATFTVDRRFAPPVPTRHIYGAHGTAIVVRQDID